MTAPASCSPHLQPLRPDGSETGDHGFGLIFARDAGRQSPKSGADRDRHDFRRSMLRPDNSTSAATARHQAKSHRQRSTASNPRRLRQSNPTEPGEAVSRYCSAVTAATSFPVPPPKIPSGREAFAPTKRGTGDFEDIDAADVTRGHLLQRVAVWRAIGGKIQREMGNG